MVEAIIHEIHLRKDYLSQKELNSIYFGGGTPSLLDASELEDIFSALAKVYTWNDQTEITLEANPDDLSQTNLKGLKSIGINRLSIGIQSFDQDDLSFMNRAHNANEAENCLKMAQDEGFENITADLIYGSPTTSNTTCLNNIDRMVSFDIPHISAYNLTVEEGTALHHFVKVGKSAPVDDEKSSEQFNMLIERLTSKGYDHYEISNFGKPNRYAIHNTNYWLGAPYLGIGPGAHSFDGISTRSWNIAHNPKYIKSIQENQLPIEHEVLSITDRFNEYILIRLRTKWGINFDEVENKFPQFSDALKGKLHQYIERNDVIEKDGSYQLSNSGKLLADRISMELFEE